MLRRAECGLLGAASRPMFPQRRISHVQGYLALGMIAEAAAELDCITGPDAQSAAVNALRLAVLQEQRKWPDVRELARVMLRETPDEAALWVTLAYATRRAESLESADQILLDAELIHPNEPTIQFNLGCYACQRGDLAAARKRVDRAIALDKKFAGLAATDPDLEPLRLQQRKDT